jgi:thiol-disulfide isomerase/thioredoxin
LGGTDVSRALLVKSAPAEAAQEGRWEKPEKEMKSWQLSDLNGKTWKLASFEGKTMLINVWASWCGPCKAEHPKLQKLYERVKNDPSIGIITFNIDEEIGKVAPYIKENKYTFPVLLAKDYADELSVDSIPRNWIIDAKEKWQWQQIGFGNEDKWEDEMLARIKETK